MNFGSWPWKRRCGDTPKTAKRASMTCTPKLLPRARDFCFSSPFLHFLRLMFTHVHTDRQHSTSFPLEGAHKGAEGSNMPVSGDRSACQPSWRRRVYRAHVPRMCVRRRNEQARWYVLHFFQKFFFAIFSTPFSFRRHMVAYRLTFREMRRQHSFQSHLVLRSFVFRF